MADKSVAQKLLFKENYKVLLLNEPKDYTKDSWRDAGQSHGVGESRR